MDGSWFWCWISHRALVDNIRNSFDVCHWKKYSLPIGHSTAFWNINIIHIKYFLPSVPALHPGGKWKEASCLSFLRLSSLLFCVRNRKILFILMVHLNFISSFSSGHSDSIAVIMDKAVFSPLHSRHLSGRWAWAEGKERTCLDILQDLHFLVSSAAATATAVAPAEIHVFTFTCEETSLRWTFTF